MKNWLHKNFALPFANGAVADFLPAKEGPEDDEIDADGEWNDDPIGQLYESGLVVRDFRNLRLWPREKKYNFRRYGWPGNKKRARPRGWIPLSVWRGLLFHTTGTVPIGPDRFLGIPIHFGVDKDAGIILCHNVTRLLYHAHAGNRYTGVEISGMSDATDAQIESGRLICKYFEAIWYKTREKHGLETRKPEINIHRQTHESRPKDPGADIFEGVVLWALENGYTMGPVLGSGRPAPAKGEAW